MKTKMMSRVIIGGLCIFTASTVFPKASVTDAFQKCMLRTQQDRLSCSVGCGMILQQCYDEGVADTNKRASRLLSQIGSENGNTCKNLAQSYLSDAAHMESTVVQKASDIPGWVGSEMAFNFARQRLDNLVLIHQSCKP